MTKRLLAVAAATALGALAAGGLATGASHAENDPYVGEIQAVAQNWCPRGWNRLDGQLLPIAGNDALFSLLGCNFGGDCRTTFALPDARGRALVSWGQGPGLPNYPFASRGGAQYVTLTSTNLPGHAHGLHASAGDPERFSPAGAGIPTIPNPAQEIYTTAAPTTAMMHSGVIGSTGGGQSMSIVQPNVAVNYCIAIYGVYPSRS